MAKPTHILVRNASEHNLKHITVEIPRNKLVVITGVSGSGKSSLAFDTIYAEGQRRYVESLSSYARQFMGKLEKPKVEEIIGLSPSIAIEQKVSSRNSRSTVGTATEIYDYLKLLFARIGVTYSPISGDVVQKHSVTNVVDFILNQVDKRVLLLVQLGGQWELLRQIEILEQQGFTRLYDGKNFIRLEDAKELKTLEGLTLLIDRFAPAADDTDDVSRIADSISTAFFEGAGTITIEVIDGDEHEMFEFSNRFELDGMTFIEPSEHLFSFNNPLGACKTCDGFGSVIGVDADLVIPDNGKSVYDEAIACWRGEKMSWYKDEFIRNAHKVDFDIHKPIADLTKKEEDILWNGGKGFSGITGFFEELERNTHKIQYRVLLSRYRGKTGCHSCYGTRLAKESQYVKIGGKNLSELVLLSIDKLSLFFGNLELNAYDTKVSERILEEVSSRLGFLQDVGLGYLTLNRGANTLSGGESQRINLATSLGSSLVGSLYVLDEPSIGLHSRDTQRLIKVLKHLRGLGNTVLVVEHDEEIMEIADEIIDMGPLAGTHGGHVVFQGNFEAILKDDKSLTGAYLSGKNTIEIDFGTVDGSKGFLEIEGAQENNLQKADCKFPINALSVITGVSGSGKSTLVKKIIYPAVRRLLGEGSEFPGKHKKVSFPDHAFAQIEFVDQNPIGKSSRSNPVTYIKAFDDIRNLFSSERLSKIRGFKPSHFSFNVPGGRCDECDGEGQVTVEMQFIADIKLNCESCNGKRYKEEVLDVKVHGKSISDVLDLTVDEAIEFFNENRGTIENRIVNKLDPLAKVGLGYVTLGQSASTLSGGEAQRIKLASFIGKGGSQEKSLFIFDEPTTGLHFYDIKKLLTSIQLLINDGHTVLIIEHNFEVIKNAQWLVDLGPDGGENGGRVLYQGEPNGLLDVKESHTAQFLKGKSVVTD